jgi:HemY protein
LLQAEALASCGRAQEAFARLETLGNEQAVSVDGYAALELRFGTAAMSESTNADALSQRWNNFPQWLRETAAMISAYAQRAAELGLEDDAAQVIADALDRQWDDGLVDLYGKLPAGRDDTRLARTEKWLRNQPDNPALLLCQGRLFIAAQVWNKAEERLHRAIVHGGGSDAWENLGRVFSAQGNSANAEVAYANALRLPRGEPALTLSGRSLREQIASEAVAELRNEHGLPLLPR